MTVSPPTFPLSTRYRATLYALVLVAVAAFADTEGDVTPLLLAGVAAALAWLLVDSGSEPVHALLRRGLAGLLAVPPDLHSPGVSPAGAVRSDPVQGGVRRAVARWVIASCAREQGVPILVLNAVVLVAAANLGREVWAQSDQGSQNLILALTHFMLTLLLCKLFERKGVRDAVLILVLSLLIVVAATMFSASGLFFFCILGAYFLLLFCAVVLLNLAAETQRLGSLAPMPAVIPAPRVGRAAGRGRGGPLALLRRDLRTTVQHCVFLVLPIAVVVFLLVPRTRGNPLLSPWGLGSYQTGFTDVVQFRDYGQLSQSEAEVMKVRLSRNGNEVGAEFSELYFRGQVLDEYSSSRSAWIHRSVIGDPPPVTLAEADGPRIDVSYELLIPAGRTVFILAPSLPPDSESFNYSAADMTWQFKSSLPRPAPPLKYAQVWVRNLPPAVAASPYITPGQLAPAPVYGPEGQALVPTLLVSPQIDQLAHALIKDTVLAGQRMAPGQIRGVVTVFENYLRTTYPYSLTFRQVDPKLDPTTDFLVNRKSTGGHCEYFASAMVMLCRAVGLNARVVAGYHGGEYKATDLGLFGDKSYFLVRQKNAHAWAEVYIPDQGWVLSDPSPSADNPGAAAATGRWYRDILQILQSAWLTTVVSFDNDSRAAIGRWFSARLDFLLDRPSLPPWSTAAIWAAIMLLVVLAVLLRRRFRRLAPLIESTRGLPHRQARLSTHISFLEDLLHLFDRAGTRRLDLTPLEFLQPHLARLGLAAADARWLVVTAYGVRFGGLQVDGNLKHEIARALKNVKSALRTKNHP